MTALAALLLLPGAALPQAAPAPPQVQLAPSADESFARLEALVGTWRPADNPASPLRIRFWLTAGGTALVESWERAGQPHSLTLYHRDGGTLIATHYCPQGNQPRLVLASAGREIRFAFRDATDLSKGESHLHDLALDLRDSARVIRRETYRSGSTSEESTLTLVRAGPEA